MCEIFSHSVPDWELLLSLYGRWFFCCQMVTTLVSGRGRKPGSLNKVSQILKEALMDSFDRLGGAAYLEAVGRQDPKTYLTLLAKVLPSRSQAADPADTAHSLTDNALNDRLAALLRDSGVSREAIATGDSVDAEVVSVLRKD